MLWIYAPTSYRRGNSTGDCCRCQFVTCARRIIDNEPAPHPLAVKLAVSGFGPSSGTRELEIRLDWQSDGPRLVDEIVTVRVLHVS